MPVHMSLCHIQGMRTLTIIMHSKSSSLRLRIKQVQVQGSQAQAQGQPRQEVASMDAEEFVNRITAMMQS
jgi:hypothetical protein